ncbi:neuronal acetylcholine receptor subunit alpha-2-like [Haliotis cracherodii]|uniref:neuronal acetylcholine receptor subunit alpha-2-like n=1 Tax=Haliotis cracherodii TaxID=6455 RepID=UPI0039ED6059
MNSMKLACVLVCLTVCVFGASAQLYDRLFRTLMKGYTRDVMPRTSVNSTISVKFNLQLIQVHELSVSFQLLKTEVWLTLSWQDPRLRWDPAEFNNVQKMAVPAGKVWIPDIMLYNGASGIRAATVQALVYSDGSVFLIRPATIRSRCPVLPGSDPTTCTLKFGSWVHNGNELDLDFQGEHKADLTDYVPNYDFDIVNNTAVRNVILYDCCPEQYIDLSYKLTFRPAALRRRRRR